MTNKIIVTPENPEGLSVALTAEEEAQRVTDAETAATERDALEAEDAQKATDKASGNQKMLDLGLSQAEVDAITK